MHIVGNCDMTVSTRVKESGRGKSLSYSGDLRKLIEKFIKTRVSIIPADTKDPAKDIQEELTTFRFDYADLDLIHRLLVSNAVVGYTHLDEIFENKGQVPEHVSLMNLISSAVDLILMKEAQRWWKQEHPKEEKAASIEKSWYKFFGVLPFYIAKEAAISPSDVDLPYKGDRLFRETMGYLQLLQPIINKNPKVAIPKLIDSYSPDFKDIDLSDLVIMFTETPTLVSTSAGEHALRFWNGTIYDVLQGVMEDAVSANAKKFVKLKEEGKLPKPKKEEKAPPSRDEVKTKELPTKKYVRDDSPTNVVDEDANATVPGGTRAKNISSSVASKIVYKGYTYIKQ